MAWIESHQEIDDHPKTRKAATLLGISVPAVIGHLHILWHWALSYAQDGDLTDFEVEDIAMAARWDGDADIFVNALLNCRLGAKRAGFLERTEEGRLLIHDWWEYAGKLVAKRQKDADRKRAEREAASAQTAPYVHRTSNGHPSAVAGREEKTTEPKTTETTEPKTTETTDHAWGAALRTFEDNIGIVSPLMLSDMLETWDMLVMNGNADWWDMAVRVAISSGKRQWKYIRGILQNCINEGHPPEPSRNGVKPKRQSGSSTTIVLPDGQVVEAKT